MEPPVITPDTWVISDSYFGSKTMVAYDDVRDTIQRSIRVTFDEWMIEQWNKVVAPSDTVLHLGNFSVYGASEFFFPRLNGKIHTLRGNYDREDPENEVGIFNGLFIDGKKIGPSYSAILNDLRLMKEVRKDDYPGARPDSSLSDRAREVYYQLNAIVTTVCVRRVIFTHFPIFSTCSYDPNEFSYHRSQLSQLAELTGAEINIHGHLNSKTSRALESTLKSINVTANEEAIRFVPQRLGTLLASRSSTS